VWGVNRESGGRGGGGGLHYLRLDLLSLAGRKTPLNVAGNVKMVGFGAWGKLILCQCKLKIWYGTVRALVNCV